MSEEQVISEEQNGEVPQQNSDKETRNYLKAMEVVKAVVGGEENLRPPKSLSGDATAKIVAELFAEEEKELHEKVKEGLKNLLKKHVELEAEIAKKEKELKDLQAKKRKEFTQAANDWLRKVKQNEIMNESYSKALKTAFTGGVQIDPPFSQD